MSEPASTARALAAAWHLLLRRPDAIREYDNSVSGFWHSFLALPIALAVRLALEFGHRSSGRLFPGEPVESGETAVALSVPAFTVVVTVTWLAFPIAMVFIARLMGLTRRYVIFIIAHNWGSLLAVVAAAVPLAAYLVLGFDIRLLVLLLIPLGIAQIYYMWIIASDGLSANMWTAAAVVAFEFLLSGLIILTLTELVAPRTA